MTVSDKFATLIGLLLIISIYQFYTFIAAPKQILSGAVISKNINHNSKYEFEIHLIDSVNQINTRIFVKNDEFSKIKIGDIYTYTLNLEDEAHLLFGILGVITLIIILFVYLMELTS